MKICIIGHSGSGKSTLARILSKHYNIPVLHMDTLQFMPGWVETDRRTFNHQMKSFLETNESWVIDGNYRKIAKERFDLADRIIYLDYNRWVCLWNAFKRYRKFKGKTRIDMANGCKEKMDLEFIKWILYKGRTKEKRAFYHSLVTHSKDGLIFKNRRSLNKYLKNNNY